MQWRVDSLVNSGVAGRVLVESVVNGDFGGVNHISCSQCCTNMSTGHAFLHVDAFTSTPLQGNPCVVVFDADDLSVETMQAIALELNLSETAFVLKSSVADFRARYFTPMEEIPLAGHPTISTIFALIHTGRLQLTAPYMSILLELQVGPIPIEIYSTSSHVDRIVMSQKKPKFQRIYSAEEVLPAFGLAAEDLVEGVPIQTVSTGTPQLMVMVKSIEVLRKARLNLTEYIALRERGDFFSPHLFCLQGITAEGQTFARHFGVPPDTMEDPFTGSASGGMGAFLWHYSLIPTASFVAQQGHLMHRPGQAYIEVIGPKEDIETVKVGGTAVPVKQGEFFL